MRDAFRLFYFERLALNCTDIIAYVSQVIDPAGYECVDIDWDGPEATLRVFIDAASGVNVTDCIKVSKMFEEDTALDALVPGEYRLEISSPGIERPLRTALHFRNVIGRRINVEYEDLVTEAQRVATGILRDLREDATLVVATDRRDIAIPLVGLVKARLVAEWN